MITIYLGVYTFILAILWGFFIVAKIHAYKFKTFSSHIFKVTKILFIFFIVLTVLGYIAIIYYTVNNKIVVKNTPNSKILEVNY